MTKIVAHRGANRFAPENTFAAADLAIEQGADYIELDVRESADGVLYVHHDETLDRTTNSSGPLGFLTSDVIDKLDAGSWYAPHFAGEKVPRLDAYLEHLRGRAGVYIEIKLCTPAKVVELVRDLNMAEETFYFSFDEDMRRQLHALAPDFRKMITLNIARSPSLAKSLHFATILEMTPEQIKIPGMLETAREQGLEVMVFYGDEVPVVYNDLAAAGLDYVNIDRTDLFMASRKCL